MTSIITGDIINSRNTPASMWLDVLKASLSKFGVYPKDWEIYRGDSFQLEVPIQKAMFACIYIKASIKCLTAIDVRMAIGVGEKDFEGKNITESNGTAFVNSGFAFDNLLKNQNLVVKSSWQDLDDEFNTSLALALLIMDNWSVTSAEFVKTSMDNLSLTQKELGKILKVSQAGISKTRKRSGLQEVLGLEKRYQNKIKLLTA